MRPKSPIMSSKFIIESIDVSQKASVPKGQQELIQGGTDVTKADPYP
jgi:hypothetical protein